MTVPNIPTCPDCDAQLVPDPDGAGLWCQFCGIQFDDEASCALADELRQTAYDPPGPLWQMDAGLRYALDRAWRDIQASRLGEAALSLHETTRLYPQSADAFYLLSHTTTDPDTKRDYLDRALALQPRHDYAWRDKGMLDGVIPPDAGNVQPVTPPDTTAELDAVEARTETQECPLCGGALQYDAGVTALVCAHCGHRAGAAPLRASARPTTTYHNLDNALLQRRYGFSRQWDIGTRTLNCQNCHAQITLGGDLTTVCPFCDSAHVLIKDATGAFKEPDAIIPFALSREDALRAVRQRAPVDVQVQMERGKAQGLYLPFWIFAGTATVSLSQTALLSAIIGLNLGMSTVEDVLVGAVERPSQAVLYELMPYDLDALQPYDRRYLAHWSAQVYQLDVVQASITARAYIKYTARRIAVGDTNYVPTMDLARTDTKAYHTPNSPVWRAAHVTIEHIGYRLLLLPVWMVTVVLRDGSHCPAVVNGQTGEAILSASFADTTITAGPNRPPITPLPATPTARRSPVIRPITPPGRSAPRSRVIRPIAPPPRK